MSLTQKPLRRMLLLALLALALIAVVVIAPTTAPAAASRSASVWGSGTLTDAELTSIIEDIQDELPCYGYRRVTHELRRHGLIINHKRVARVMRHLA